MQDLPHLLAMYVVLLPLWAIGASPLFLAFFFVARAMRRRAVRSAWAIVAFSFAFSILAAPVPTPIITVLVPHGWALFDRTYYPGILHGPAMFAGLWWWIVLSLMLTFGAALVSAWRYIRPSRYSSGPTPSRGSVRSRHQPP